MRTKITFFLCLLLMSGAAFGQSARAVLTISPEARQGSWESMPIAVPLPSVSPFLAFSVAWAGTEGVLSLRFSEDGQRWGEWEALPPDGHAEQSEQRRVSELYFAEASSRYVQLRTQAGMTDLELHFYSPGDTQPKASDKPDRTEDRSSGFCPCPQPSYEDRGDWCPDGTCQPVIPAASTVVTHLIVHHSAGTNISNDWAAVVRAIWDFHTGVNGWDDVGYNWLIDPNGVLYEGRGDNRRGAHFCGRNAGTMGVCVLGDFTNITPADEARAKLAELLAWKSCDINVDPQGSALHASSGLQLMRISGHRDGCNTACPGDMFYPQLPQVRADAVARIENNCSAIAPPANLVAELSEEVSVILNWDDQSDNESAFLIERSTAFGSGYAQIAEVPANTTTYEDTDVALQQGYYYQVRAVSEEQDTSQYTNRAFVFVTVVSTNERLHGQRVAVFPNPTSGQLNLSWEQAMPNDLQLRLLDAQGRQLMSRSLDGQQLQHELSLQQWPAGLYMIELVSGGQSAAYRVVRY